jgi:hypothetical protein
MGFVDANKRRLEVLADQTQDLGFLKIGMLCDGTTANEIPIDRQAILLGCICGIGDHSIGRRKPPVGEADGGKAWL